MMTTTTLAAQTVGNPVANIGIFSVFVVVTMIVVIKASKRNATADEFFTGGRGFSGPQNGIAIAGDYLSAASFLGIAGAIAVYGYDGFLYSIGFLVAWLVALLLVAELLRNTGRFTMADVLSFRLKQKPVRLAAATSTMTVSLFYLLAQMAGAGGLVALLLDIKGRGAQSVVIAVVGVLMQAGYLGGVWSAVKAGMGAGTVALLVGLHLLGEYGLFVLMRYDTFATAIVDQFQAVYSGPAANLMGGVLVLLLALVVGQLCRGVPALSAAPAPAPPVTTSDVAPPSRVNRMSRPSRSASQICPRVFFG